MIAERILKYFRGRADYVAVPNGVGFQPFKLDQPMRPEWMDQKHLSQQTCLGFYLMTPENRVWCTAVDFDNKPENPDEEWQDKAEGIYFELCKFGLTPTVEISQSGTAAHVWLFFDEALPAGVVRKFWYAVAESAKVPLVEVYPRQDRLSGKGLGNLVRYPLFNKSLFVDVEDEWKPIDSLAALEQIKTASADDINQIVFSLTGTTAHEAATETRQFEVSERVDRLTDKSHTLLGRRWLGDMDGLNDKSRSALVLSIACELVRNYVPTPEIEAAVRVWCDRHGYDKGGRDDWVSSTVERAYHFLSEKKVERSSTWTIEDAVNDYIEAIRRGIAPCIGSGVAALDYSIDGIAPGEVCVMAARPSHGKTAFAMQWVDYAAAKGVPCLLVSEEMSKRELGKRALLHISKLEDGEWEENTTALEDEVRSHYENRAKVYGLESVQSIDRLETLIDDYVHAHGVGLIAVDYLQLLGSNHEARYDSVTDISRRLKQSATRNNVAMLVLSQLNREIDKRDSHEPKLSDLRESGQIEQDADLVLMLQWPWKYDSNEDVNDYRVFCAKRRNGPIREPVVQTQFWPERQRFGPRVDFTFG